MSVLLRVVFVLLSTSGCRYWACPTCDAAVVGHIPPSHKDPHRSARWGKRGRVVVLVVWHVPVLQVSPAGLQLCKEHTHA